MADLVVSEAAVNEAAKQLKIIVDDLKDMDATWGDRDSWGHHAVADAMSDFIESWWVKREKLTDGLDDLQKKLEQAAEAWDETENSLVDALTGEA